MIRTRHLTLAILLVAACDSPDDYLVPVHGTLASCDAASSSWHFEVTAPLVDEAWLGLLDMTEGVWERDVELELGSAGDTWTGTIEDARLTCGELGDMAAVVLASWDEKVGAAELYTGDAPMPKVTTSGGMAPRGHWYFESKTDQDVGGMDVTFWDIASSQRLVSYPMDGARRQWTSEVSCFEVPCEWLPFVKTFTVWDLDGMYQGAEDMGL